MNLIFLPLLFFMFLMISAQLKYIHHTTTQLTVMDSKLASLGNLRSQTLNEVIKINSRLKKIHQTILILQSIPPPARNEVLIQSLRSSAFTFFNVQKLLILKESLKENQELRSTGKKIIIKIKGPKLQNLEPCKTLYQVSSIPKGYCNVESFHQSKIQSILGKNQWCKDLIILKNKTFNSNFLFGETCHDRLFNPLDFPIFSSNIFNNSQGIL